MKMRFVQVSILSDSKPKYLTVVSEWEINALFSKAGGSWPNDVILENIKSNSSAILYV